MNEISGVPINENEPFTVTEENVFMLNDPKAVKPDERYYQGVKKVVQKLKPGVALVLHVDDKKENVEGAEKVADFKGIHFHLPQGSARKSSPQELQNALKGYKGGLQKRGVFVE